MKLSLVEAMETGVEGGFREIEYGEDDTGVFVRLLKGGRERGCIGFIRGVSSPEEAVKAAAVNAAFFDKRHKRLGPEELPSLEIEITVIDRLLRIRNHLDFTPGIHTIYIKHLNMKAVMQGQIIQERGYSKEEFLRAICKKGGIPETQYREKDAEIYRANTVFMRRRFADINTGR
ncbi:MAG TPA: AMMECR1 domain-containing protein [Spirochaetota bacterium]|nr:AMMECR1 domain-containing protein [Spirochaetota bacterium]HPI14644.1 AMMECR1 domain-containing protein [Spirochaetota bacterium]HPO44627.1 AMMECR1 domain-containing protein [Spirochaetota bacterium]